MLTFEKMSSLKRLSLPSSVQSLVYIPFIIGNSNLNTATIDLLKNVIYMAFNLPVINIIQKY